MSAELWNWKELVLAAGAIREGNAEVPISGFSIDTRTLQPGDVFVAIRDVRDGHDFVLEAFRKGAAAALVEDELQARGWRRSLIAGFFSA